MIVVAVAWLAGSTGFVVGTWWASSAFARHEVRSTSRTRSPMTAHRHVGAPSRPAYRRRGRPACKETLPAGRSRKLTG